MSGDRSPVNHAQIKILYVLTLFIDWPLLVYMRLHACMVLCFKSSVLSFYFTCVDIREYVRKYATNCWICYQGIVVNNYPGLCAATMHVFALQSGAHTERRLS